MCLLCFQFVHNLIRGIPKFRTPWKVLVKENIAHLWTKTRWMHGPSNQKADASLTLLMFWDLRGSLSADDKLGDKHGDVMLELQQIVRQSGVISPRWVTNALYKTLFRQRTINHKRHLRNIPPNLLHVKTSYKQRLDQ